MDVEDTPAGISRRAVLQASAVGALWWPLRTLPAGTAAAGATPSGFPAGIELHRQVFENWALETRVDDVWTCAPRNESEVVAVANWAAANGWHVRPRGSMHGWSPMTVVPGQSPSTQVVLVDTTRHFTGLSVSGVARTFTAQAGVLIDDIMVALESAGLGLSSIPAAGSITIAGAIAVSAHGAAVPAHGERTGDRSFGSLSNRVLSMRAVVWDAGTSRFHVRTFDRRDQTTAALLSNLGRVLVTGVTVRAETHVTMRCISRVNIPAVELFAPTGAGGRRTFASFVEATGRVETILFPTTRNPWLKVWSVVPTRPRASRRANRPYNYTFADHVPLAIARLAKNAAAGQPGATPILGRASYDVTAAGLLATLSTDLWGPAKNVQLYVRESTIRTADFGWGILTSRRNVQRVVHEFVSKYHALVATYRARGLWPMNMPLQLRCSGVDDPGPIGVDGAKPPTLSASAPRPDHPDWDVVVWVNALSLAGSRGSSAFERDLEQWLIGHYQGDYATARVEWAKGWAYTDTGGWTDREVIDHVIPDGFRAGHPSDAGWDWALRRFDELDPHRVFTNSFTRSLLR